MRSVPHRGRDCVRNHFLIDNLAITNDGGITWKLVKGLSGYRSVVAYVPGAKTGTLVAVGPSGADYSTDDGRTWKVIEGQGFDTLSFARAASTSGRPIAFAAGAGGRIGKLTFPASRFCIVR